eukprot:SAG22_NODE_1168_length_5271_cov_13.249613_5_plen_90_part_00
MTYTIIYYNLAGTQTWSPRVAQLAAVRTALVSMVDGRGAILVLQPASQTSSIALDTNFERRLAHRGLSAPGPASPACPARAHLFLIVIL